MHECTKVFATCSNKRETAFLMCTSDTMMWRLNGSFWEFKFWSEKCTKATENNCNTIQENIHKLRLVLNSDKSKIVCFSKSRKTDNVCQIVTLDKRVIERVPVYKYLGFFLEETKSVKQKNVTAVSLIVWEKYLSK